MLDLKKYEKFLICPKCKGSVKFERDRIVCLSCGQIYQIDNGIPIMLSEESQKELSNSTLPRKQIGPIKIWISKLLKKFTPPEPYSIRKSNQRIEEFLSSFDSGAKVLNLGSGDRKLSQKIINLDIVNSDNVDIIGDAHNIPFVDESFEGIVCTSVLEHVWDAQKVVSEIYRVLKNKGKVYIEVPFLYPYHTSTGTDMDYRRYTETGLKNLLKKFRCLELGVGGGPSVALIVFLRHYFSELFNFWHSFNAPREFISIIVGWIFFPLKLLDIFLVKRKDIASVFYFLGEKKEE